MFLRSHLFLELFFCLSADVFVLEVHDLARCIGHYSTEGREECTNLCIPLKVISKQGRAWIDDKEFLALRRTKKNA